MAFLHLEDCSNGSPRRQDLASPPAGDCPNAPWFPQRVAQASCLRSSLVQHRPLCLPFFNAAAGVVRTGGHRRPPLQPDREHLGLPWSTSVFAARSAGILPAFFSCIAQARCARPGSVHPRPRGARGHPRQRGTQEPEPDRFRCSATCPLPARNHESEKQIIRCEARVLCWRRLACRSEVLMEHGALSPAGGGESAAADLGVEFLG